MKIEKIQNNNEEQLKEKSRKLSIKEGVAFSFMDGFGLRYITPYAIQLGANNTIIGLITSIPSLIGNFSQLHGSKIIEKTSRKKLVATSIFIQALMWLPLIILGILFYFSKISSLTASILLIFFYTIMILFGSLAGPAWSSWMKDLIPKNPGNYFGKRNAIVGIFALANLLIAGVILEQSRRTNVFLGFGILFTIAFLGRLISSYLFTKQYEPKIIIQKDNYFSFFQFIKKMPYNNFGKYAIFSSLIQFTVAIASPFFAVYMLKELSFNYIYYTIVTMSSLFSTLIIMSYWGKFADRYGNIKVIKLTGNLIFLVPLLWIIPYISEMHNTFTIFLFLIFVEIFSGIIWAGFNLSSSNFIYDAVTRERMALCVAYSNILNAIGIFIGATLGGILSSFNFNFLKLSPILFIFLLSGILRFFVFRIMSPKIKEVREVDYFDIKKIKDKFIKIYPRQIMQNIGIKRIGFNSN